MSGPTRSSKRTRRPGTRKTQVVNFSRHPGLMERIEVLWDVDNTLQWWPAEVISTDGSSTMPYSKRSNATLRYVATEKYDESDYKVRFHRVSSGVKKLIHICPRTEDWVPWKYPEEHVDVTQFQQSQNVCASPTSSDKPCETANSLSLKTKQPRARSQQKLTSPNNSNHTVPDNTHTDLSNAVEPANAAAQTSTGGTGHNTGALLTNEANDSLNLSTLLTTAATSGYMNQKSALVSFITSNIKYNIVSKFSAPLSKSRFCKSGVEGYDSSELVIRTVCDLDSFIALAKTTSTPQSSSSATNLRYCPTNSSFTNPSRATLSLSIEFRHLLYLLEHVHIRDPSDKAAIACKSVNRKSSRLIRLLASSCVLTVPCNRSDKPSVKVHCVLPSQSLTSRSTYHIKRVLQSIYDDHTTHSSQVLQQENYTAGQDILFFRFREHYDEAQGRFLSPWKATSMKNDCFHSESASTPQHQTAEDSTFSMEWSTSPPASHTLWTSDATYTGEQVLGNVTVFFPIVTFFGDATIREIEALITQYL